MRHVGRSWTARRRRLAGSSFPLRPRRSVPTCSCNRAGQPWSGTDFSRFHRSLSIQPGVLAAEWPRRGSSLLRRHVRSPSGCPDDDGRFPRPRHRKVGRSALDLRGRVSRSSRLRMHRNYGHPARAMRVFRPPRRAVGRAWHAPLGQRGHTSASPSRHQASGDGMVTDLHPQPITDPSFRPQRTPCEYCCRHPAQHCFASLKIGRSAVRPRPWPPPEADATHCRPRHAPEGAAWTRSGRCWFWPAAGRYISSVHQRLSRRLRPGSPCSAQAARSRRHGPGPRLRGARQPVEGGSALLVTDQRMRVDRHGRAARGVARDLLHHVRRRPLVHSRVRQVCRRS